jgi:hypothetical protein
MKFGKELASMTPDEKKPVQPEVTKTLEELEDEEEMRKASMGNPADACGREEDRFGK